MAKSEKERKLAQREHLKKVKNSHNRKLREQGFNPKKRINATEPQTLKSE